MNLDELKKKVQDIVAQAKLLSASHTSEGNAPVNYACIFAQSQEEFDELAGLTHQLGKVVQDTAMGPVFKIEPISTVSGDLHLLKIRRPDLKRQERGDADFTVSDYQVFKMTYLGKPGFAIIERKDMEMIELRDPAFRVISYYSHPTLAQVLKLEI